MKNIRSLFGKTFTVTSNGDGAVGNVIEVYLGGLINSNKGADLGFWEIKSKDINSNSKMTINSVGKYGSVEELINNATKKIRNTIRVNYTRCGNTFTVVSVEICYGFNENWFRSNVGKLIKLETRSNGEKSLRIAKGYFGMMFNKVTVVR